MAKARQTEYLAQPFHEVESMIKAKNAHDLSINQFATISGIKGVQFGREVFTTLVPFKDLMDFLQVFPNVQRSINKRRVGSIKTYVLGGLDDPENMRFFSAITVTCRGHMFYSEDTMKVAIDTANSRLSVNDGQHRFYGIAEAIRELRGKVNNGRTEEDREEARIKLKELESMVIPLVMFNQITEVEEKQLFHDLNNLAQRPSRSATIKLAQTDRFSQMSREIAVGNRYMVHYGVEMDKVSIHGNNKNTVLLTTIYSCIRAMYSKEIVSDKNFLTWDNYEAYKGLANETFSDIFYVLPHDLGTKGKYIIEKNYALKGIVRFIHHCRNVLNLDEKTIFNTIGKVDWTLNIEYWKPYGANESRLGNLLFSGGEGGISAVFDCLIDTLGFKERQTTFDEIASSNLD